MLAPVIAYVTAAIISNSVCLAINKTKKSKVFCPGNITDCYKADTGDSTVSKNCPLNNQTLLIFVLKYVERVPYKYL